MKRVSLYKSLRHPSSPVCVRPWLLGRCRDRGPWCWVAPLEQGRALCWRGWWKSTKESLDSASHVRFCANWCSASFAKRPVWGWSSSLILHLPVPAVKLTLMFLQFFPRRHDEKPSTRRRRWQRYNTYEWNPACCWHFLSGCSCLVLSRCVRINHKTSALHLNLSLQSWDKSGESDKQAPFHFVS